MADKEKSIFLRSATAVFNRYGFRKTTMGDLAEAAGISRPALYLRFSNKEQIFDAVCHYCAEQLLKEIRIGVGELDTPFEKLRFAFELWVVRSIALMAVSPDTRDVEDPVFKFAREASKETDSLFEAELRTILENTCSGKENPDIDFAALAHLLAAAARGFRTSAHSSQELPQLIDCMLKVVLASMG